VGTSPQDTSLHFSPTLVAKRRRGLWPPVQRALSEPEAGPAGCKACDRGHRSRIHGDTLRRPTERNAADAALSDGAADSR
jgi:hypothetical protein